MQLTINKFTKKKKLTINKAFGPPTFALVNVKYTAQTHQIKQNSEKSQRTWTTPSMATKVYIVYVSIQLYICIFFFFFNFQILNSDMYSVLANTLLFFFLCLVVFSSILFWDFCTFWSCVWLYELGIPYFCWDWRLIYGLMFL